MNYFVMAKNSLKKNMKNQVTFLIICIISVTLHFLYTTLVYNSGTVLISKVSLLAIILKASIVIIIILLSFFTIYSYTSYIRLRKKEFTIKILIGMTKNELALCLMLENLILMVVCVSVGIILGTIFSKIFFLLIINYLGFPNLLFSLSAVNYTSTLEFFIILYVIIVLRTRRLLKNMDKSNDFNLCKPIKEKVEKIKIYAYIIIYILDIVAIIYTTQTGGKKYLYLWLACMLMIYGVVFYGRKALIFLMKKGNGLYKSKFILLQQFATNVKKDSVFIFLIAYVSFLFITYNLVCEIGVFNKYSGGISGGELRIFRLLAMFTNLLFFAISSSITYFKFQMELENINKYFKKLYMIGVTKEEFEFLIRYRLRILFFVPCTLCAVASIIFVLSIGFHSRRFSFNEGVILIAYAFNIYGYKKSIMVLE